VLGELRPELLVPLREPVVARFSHAADASLAVPGCPARAEITPDEPDPGNAGEGRKLVPRCLTIAGSDSGGGAGIQADLKAFAAARCHGMSAIVALTAQNTTGVTAVHEVPPEFVRAQLEAVFDDLGVDAAKSGMLFSAELIETVADFLEAHPVTLVVDPVMVASSGSRLLQEDAVETLVTRLFPLATVITPNLMEAQALVPSNTVLQGRFELAEALHGLGAGAVIVTGGHGDPVDHLFDGERHVEIPVERHELAATHGAGCTHSATLAALLARGDDLETAARGAAEAASRAVAQGLAELGAGDGPVDVIGLRGAA
jgi:hydroxymethylpyrimidine/phosphomethylpyrimidine kinase